MAIVQEARPPRCLKEVIVHIADMPCDHSLFIPLNCDSLGFETMCHEVSGDDYPDGEIEDFCRTKQLKEFFSKDQLVDILNNLAQQKSPPSDEDILKAINYYWKHEAFITID